MGAILSKTLKKFIMLNVIKMYVILFFWNRTYEWLFLIAILLSKIVVKIRIWRQDFQNLFQLHFVFFGIKNRS